MTLIRSADLLNIASSAINAHNNMLRTTGNNIANVNTEGFVRERTTYVAELTGGVGRGTTERILNTFAQNQLRRDTSTLGEAQAFYDKISQLDNMLASEANSISGSLSRFFASMQTAIDEPGNLASRDLVLGEANSLMERMSSLAKYMRQMEKDVNQELASVTLEANDLIKTISTLNDQIRYVESASTQQEAGVLRNERDLAIQKLSEIVSIETRTMDDGSTLVHLKNGEALVMEAGVFNLFQISGDPDAQRRKLTLVASSAPVTLGVDETDMGGKMGGLFSYRDEVLGPKQRELGQLALAFADAMNEQNQLGMDYDGQLGAKLFELPEFQALGYQDNSSSNLLMNGRVEENQAEHLTTSDYRVTINAVNAGAPPTLDATVELFNADGSPTLDTNGNPIVYNFSGANALVTGAGNWNKIGDGLELEFPSGAYAVDDRFLLQPTRNAASQIDVDVLRGEDLAFASPIKAEGSINNLGSAVVVSTEVTNTHVDNTAPFDPNTSAFDGAGGLHGPGVAPGGGVGAPTQIRFTAADTFEVLDSAGTVITTVTGAADLRNLLEQAKGTPGWPAAFSPPAQADYPGYDISLEGVPKAGDTFSIGYNTDGVDDNRNGLALAGLQDVNTVRRDASKPYSDQNATTFHGAYADTVSSVGEKAASANIELKAAKAMVQQSTDWFQSVSGVSLDEEAANLIRFQQAYAASARILSTAQSLFDTILSAAR
ncbi:flagellar hook-associated protein FlgK [Bowmanella yangjiangensis]|uniref:flagellar hook-associated protein FlgK n=1 Tax=Bowmanella yangjiangensis TaxID=2811230 RepID=UPI001E5C4A94|nr:flagellar hook-associated protein FlgK [Bowmanella yangjiangensis]